MGNNLTQQSSDTDMATFAARSKDVAPAVTPTVTIVQTRRGPIECVVAGAGPAILALHGGMGGYDQSWLLARCLLADIKGYRIIAISRPGYLGTPLSVGRAPEEQADAYAELLDALGIASAAIAAVSAGGPSALQFALRHPARCSALILVSTCSGRLEVSPQIIRRLWLMRLLAYLPGVASMMRKRAEKNTEAAARRSIVDPAIRARTSRHPVAGSLMRALQVSVFDRLQHRLPGTTNDTLLFGRLPPQPMEPIAAPTLVIHGAADRVVPFSHAASVASHAPRAELLAIDSGEHLSLFTHLDEVRARVERFLAANYPPA